MIFANKILHFKSDKLHQVNKTYVAYIKEKARFILQRKYNFVVIRVYVSKHLDVAMQNSIYYSHPIFKDFTIPLVYALNSSIDLPPKKSQIDL